MYMMNNQRYVTKEVLEIKSDELAIKRAINIIDLINLAVCIRYIDKDLQNMQNQYKMKI